MEATSKDGPNGGTWSDTFSTWCPSWTACSVSVRNRLVNLVNILRPSGLRCLPSMREQLLEAADGLGRQSLNDVLEVVGRVNAMAAIDTPGWASNGPVNASYRTAQRQALMC